MILSACSNNRSELNTRVDEYFKALNGMKVFSGEVLISRGEETLFNKHYGYENFYPRKTDYNYAIGSISKTLTAVLVLKLAEQGKLSLNDPIEKFIPDFPSGNLILISDLLKHQAGIPRELEKQQLKQIPLDLFVKLIKKEKLEFKPGTNFRYTNLGYKLLSYIVEQITGTTYENAILELFQKHLNIQNFGYYNFTSKEQLLKHNIAPGLTNEKKQLQETPVEHLNSWGDGGLYCTTQSLMKFGELLFAAKIISQESLAKMLTTDTKSKYGLGIVISDKSRIRSFHHLGAIMGYKSYWARLNDEYSVVVLSNQDDMPVAKIATDIPKIIDGHKYELPKAVNRKSINVPSNTLEQYTGKYFIEIDKSQFFTIKLADKNLSLTDQDNNVSNLKPETHNSFFSDPQSEDTFVFVEDKNGEFYIEITIMGGMKIIAERWQLKKLQPTNPTTTE